MVRDTRYCEFTGSGTRFLVGKADVQVAVLFQHQHIRDFGRDRVDGAHEREVIHRGTSPRVLAPRGPTPST